MHIHKHHVQLDSACAVKLHELVKNEGKYATGMKKPLFKKQPITTVCEYNAQNKDKQ